MLRLRGSQALRVPALRPTRPPPSPLSFHVTVAMSSSLRSLIDLTGADAATAHLFLESCGFDLNAAASAYWEQQASEQRKGRRAVTANRLAADDELPAPVPAREDQLYDGQTERRVAE